MDNRLEKLFQEASPVCNQWFKEFVIVGGVASEQKRGLFERLIKDGDAVSIDRMRE
jgi:hypothetical protein